jgi:hypothetical protein
MRRTMPAKEFIRMPRIIFMKIKISATFEGKCMRCSHDKTVFSAGDEESKKVVTLCQDCANELGDTPTSDVIDRFGKCDSEAFCGSGIEIEGLDKVQEKLKEKASKTKKAKKKAG